VASGRKRVNPSRSDRENPELTAEDMRRVRPALEVLPKEVVEAIRRYRDERSPQSRKARRVAARTLTAKRR